MPTILEKWHTFFGVIHHFARTKCQLILFSTAILLYFLIIFNQDHCYQTHVNVTNDLSQQFSTIQPSLQYCLDSTIYSKRPSINQIQGAIQRTVSKQPKISSFSIAEFSDNGTIVELVGNAPDFRTACYASDSLLHLSFHHGTPMASPLLRASGGNLVSTFMLPKTLLPENMHHVTLLFNLDAEAYLDNRYTFRLRSIFMALIIFCSLITLCTISIFRKHTANSPVTKLFIPVFIIITVHLATLLFFIVGQHRQMQYLFCLADNLNTSRSSLHGKSGVDHTTNTDSIILSRANHETTPFLAISSVVSDPDTRNMRMFLTSLHEQHHNQIDLALFISLLLFSSGIFILYSRLSGINNTYFTDKNLSDSIAAQHDAILTNANVGIGIHEMIFDKNGTPIDYVFITTNPAFEKITGLKSEHIKGKRVTEVIPGIEKTNFIPLYGKVVSTGRPISIEEYSEPLKKHFSIHSFVIRKNFFAVIFNDITDRIEAASLHQLSKNVFDTIPTGLHVYRINTTGATSGFSLVSSNASATRLLDIYLAHTIGKPPDFFFGTPGEDLLLSKMSEVLHMGNTRTRIEITCSIPSGEQRTFLFAIFPLPDTMIGVLFEDITQQRKLRQDLANSQLSLSAALAESQNMTKELQQSIELRRQFISNMTHEIHTPLTGIIGMANILDRNVQEVSYHKQVKSILSNATQLYTLINNIADVSMIDSGSITLSPVNFHLDIDVLRLLSDMYYRRVHEKGLKLSITFNEDTILGLNGDVDKLRKILSHLLDNAIKFTTRGTITLNIETIDKTADSVRLKFSIDDSGIGIPEEHQKRLFTKFTQANPTTSRPFGGTGIGLYISNKLVESMQGTISFISLQNMGSTFYVSLPFKIRTVPPEPLFSGNSKSCSTSKPATVRAQRCRILLVEDNAVNQELGSYVLTSADIDFDVAENGIAALRMLTHISYDLVLMDCQMPEMDGYETTKQLRSSLIKNNTVPVVALTAHFTSEDRQKCLDAGMDDYVMKPISEAKLATILKTWVTPDISVEDVATDTSADPHSDVSLSSVNIWNRTAMLELCMNDAAIMQKIVAQFEASIPRYIEQLTNAVHKRDAQQIALVAHNIKGVAATMSADSLKETAAHITDSARAEENSDYTSLLNGILNQFEMLKSMLTEYMKEQDV